MHSTYYTVLLNYVVEIMPVSACVAVVVAAAILTSPSEGPEMKTYRPRKHVEIYVYVQSSWETA